MQWVEVIQIQAVEKNRARCVQEIMKELRLEGMAAEGLSDIKIYRHAAVDTDIGVHLRWNSASPAPEGSAVALQLADVLSDFGIVHHSVWVEVPVMIHSEY